MLIEIGFAKKTSNNKYAQSSEIKSVFWYPQKLRSLEQTTV